MQPTSLSVTPTAPRAGARDAPAAPALTLAADTRSVRSQEELPVLVHYEGLFEKVETLQNLLVSHATGETGDGDEYRQLRTELLREPLVKDRLPPLVRRHRDLGQFWQFIKGKFPSYRERREYLWEEFRPALELLEQRSDAPVDRSVVSAIQTLSSETVHSAWLRAMERRSDDPEAALTAARTLLETVCKHILDDRNVSYSDEVDLPRLYRLTAESLSIAPSQHTERVFKQILGGCTAVVEGLGSLRNKLGDAHGKGRLPVRPSPRHAELAVNLAGAMATFLVATWEARQ